MICRSCGKELGEGQDTCSDCYGNPFDHTGAWERLIGWFPPWPRGQPDFDKDKVNLNLGALRFVGLRCIQVVVYSSVIFNWVGIKPGFWSIFLPILSGLLYGIVDYVKIIPQEQGFAYDKNPGLTRLEGKIDRILEKK